MTWLITVIMVFTLSPTGEMTSAKPVMEVNRQEVANMETCKEVAEANNKTYRSFYDTTGLVGMSSYDYCETEL